MSRPRLDLEYDMPRLHHLFSHLLLLGTLARIFAANHDHSTRPPSRSWQVQVRLQPDSLFAFERNVLVHDTVIASLIEHFHRGRRPVGRNLKTLEPGL